MALDLVDRPRGAAPIPKAPDGKGAKLTGLDGYNVNTLHRRPKETKQGVQGETVPVPKPEVSTELAQRFADDLHKDLQRLVNLERRYQGANFDQFLRDSGHGYYLPLYEKFVKGKKGTDLRSQSIDDAEFNKFIQTDAGLALAYQIRQYKLQEQSLAAAAVISMTQDEPDPEAIRSGSSTTKRGGILNEIGRRIGQFMREPTVGRNYGRGLTVEERSGRGTLWVNSKGEVVLGMGSSSVTLGTVGLVIGGPVGAGIGAAIGAAVPGGLAAIARLSRRGETIQIDTNRLALSTVFGDPGRSTKAGPNAAQMEWNQAFYGIDSRDYELRGGRIRVRQDRVAGTRINARDLKQDLMGTAADLQAFQEQMPIRNEYIRPMDVSWLLDGRLVPPQQGTDFEHRLMERFDANGETARRNPTPPPNFINNPGIRDINGNGRYLVNPMTGALIDNPAFDRTNPDVPGNVDRWRHAYQDILTDEINIVMRSIIDGEANLENDMLGEIRSRREANGPKGELARKRKERLDKREKALGEDHEKLSPELAKLTDYQKKLQETREEIRVARQQLTDVLIGVTVGGAPPADANALLLGLNQVNTPGAAIDIEIGGFGTITNIPTEEQRIRGEKDRLYGASIYPAEVARARADAAAHPLNTTPPDPLANEFHTQYAEIQAEAKAYRDSIEASAQERLDDAKEQIRQLRETIRNAQREVREGEEKLSKVEGRSDAVSTLRDMSLSRTTIEGYSLPAAPPLPAIDLDTPVLGDPNTSYEEIERRINAAFARNANFGWPTAENSLQEHHNEIWMAMADARAQQTIAGRAPVPRFADATDSALFAMNIVDLMSLPWEEIRNRMDARNTSMGLGLAIPGQAEIEAIQREAADQYRIRSEEFKQVDRLVQRERQRSKGELAALDEGRSTTPELDGIERATRRYNQSVERIMDEVVDNNDLDEFLSLQQTTAAADRYTDYERDATRNFSQAYVNIMRTVFDHTTDYKATWQEAEGPEASFRRNETLLSEAQLMTMLTDEFNLGAALGGVVVRPANLVQAVEMLRVGMGLEPTVPLPFGMGYARGAGTISRKELAHFLSESVIYGYMRPMIKRF